MFGLIIINKIQIKTWIYCILKSKKLESWISNVGEGIESFMHCWWGGLVYSL